MKTYHQKARKYYRTQKKTGVPESEICDYLRAYYRKHGDYFSSYITSWWRA